MSVSILITLSSILLFGAFGKSVARNVHDAAGALEAEAEPNIRDFLIDGALEK